ncbi:histone-like nucleoid-structuring protein Lsr2 [Actinomycetes bacterium M1A6_2h]
MAKRKIIELTDDLDGSVITAETGETVQFSLDGVEYSIDLKNKNAKELRRTFEAYTAHATRVGGRRKRVNSSPAVAHPSAVSPTKAGGKRDPEQTRAIRQWAADEGYTISDRGRIPASIEEAFTAAH